MRYTTWITIWDMDKFATLEQQGVDPNEAYSTDGEHLAWQVTGDDLAPDITGAVRDAVYERLEMAFCGANWQDEIDAIIEADASAGTGHVGDAAARTVEYSLMPADEGYILDIGISFDTGFYTPEGIQQSLDQFVLFAGPGDYKDNIDGRLLDVDGRALQMSCASGFERVG